MRQANPSEIRSRSNTCICVVTERTINPNGVEPFDAEGLQEQRRPTVSKSKEDIMCTRADIYIDFFQ